MNDQKLHTLRRTAAPYIGQTVIWIIVTVFILIPSQKIPEWQMILVAFAIWAGYAYAVIYIGLKYKISWTSEEIIQEAAGAPATIKMSEIKKVVYEMSGPTDMLAMARPLRRIAIYGMGDHKSNRVDVSLKHFNLDDVRELLKAIQDHCPDLSVPSLDDILRNAYKRRRVKGQK